MKQIPEPQLSDVTILTPADMNKIHFAGPGTPLLPGRIRRLATAKPPQPAK